MNETDCLVAAGKGGLHVIRHRIAYFMLCLIMLPGCSDKFLTSTEQNKTSDTSSQSIHEISITTQQDIDESYQWQLRSIYDSSDIWQRSDTDNVDSDWYCNYSITDLDRDGCLEVIKRYSFSNGPVTRLWVYEVTEDMNMIRMDSDVENDERYTSANYPDIENGDIIGYYTAEDGNVRYLLNDCKSYGLSSVYNDYGLFSLQDNHLVFEIVCTAHSEDAGHRKSYFNAEGNEITEDEFNQLYSDYEALAEDEVRLCWFSEITMDNIIESYRVFYGI